MNHAYNLVTPISSWHIQFMTSYRRTKIPSPTVRPPPYAHRVLIGREQKKMIVSCVPSAAKVNSAPCASIPVTNNTGILNIRPPPNRNLLSGYRNNLSTILTRIIQLFSSLIVFCRHYTTVRYSPRKIVQRHNELLETSLYGHSMVPLYIHPGAQRLSVQNEQSHPSWHRTRLIKLPSYVVRRILRRSGLRDCLIFR